MWGGIFIVEPGAKTGIHHHGEQETIAYVLEGECEMRWGDRGEFSSAAEARSRYERYLSERLAARRPWLAEAVAAREQRRIEAPLHLKARR